MGETALVLICFVIVLVPYCSCCLRTFRTTFVYVPFSICRGFADCEKAKIAQTLEP